MTFFLDLITCHISHIKIDLWESLNPVNILIQRKNRFWRRKTTCQKYTDKICLWNDSFTPNYNMLFHSLNIKTHPPTHILFLFFCALTMSSGKKTRGRQKIEMKKMSNESNLQVTFSKRRSGLFKKASTFCTLCGAYVALIIFSPSEKVFSFGHPNSGTIIDRFLSQIPP